MVQIPYFEIKLILFLNFHNIITLFWIISIKKYLKTACGKKHEVFFLALN